MAKAKAAASKNVNVSVESAKSSKPVKSVTAPVKGAKAAEKEVKPVVAKVEKVAKVKAPKAPTKADAARAMFASMAGSERKDVIAAFKSQIGLSENAAATYYQNIKAKAGKAAVAPVAAAKEAEPVAEIVEAGEPVAEGQSAEAAAE
jgi:murein DD-endopeptidase MepM/ murein hydrolase activator NlpD